jgi:hypothetical protein
MGWNDISSSGLSCLLEMMFFAFVTAVECHAMRGVWFNASAPILELL